MALPRAWPTFQIPQSWGGRPQPLPLQLALAMLSSTKSLLLPTSAASWGPALAWPQGARSSTGATLQGQGGPRHGGPRGPRAQEEVPWPWWGQRSLQVLGTALGQ